MTNNTKTREAHDAYLANRKQAGRAIDIETCEIAYRHVNCFDPYATDPWDDDPPNDLFEQARDDVSECCFVRSEESSGWIVSDDLPPEKQQALKRRIEFERKPRERKRKLCDAARAVHPMYEVDTHEMATVGWFVWKGDGEEPSRDALIEWFKVNHPAQASEAESEIRRRELERERNMQLWQQAQDRGGVKGD